MRNEYLDRIVSSSETDVCGQLNKRLTGSPADNFLYFYLGFLISDHLRLDEDWNPYDRWIDDISFFDSVRLDSETLSVVGNIWWGNLPETSNGNFAPIEGWLRLHHDGRLDYDLRINLDGIARRIRPSGIEYSGKNEPSPVTPRPEPFVEVLVKRASEKHPRSSIPYYHEAICLSLIENGGPEAIRRLIEEGPPQLLPVLLSIGGSLPFPEGWFVERCLEYSDSSDDPLRLTALKALFEKTDRQEGLHPKLVEKAEFLWNQHTGESASYDERLVCLLGSIASKTSKLDRLLRESLGSEETFQEVISVLLKTESNISTTFLPEVLGFLHDLSQPPQSRLARIGFSFITKLGEETALPIFLEALQGTNSICSEAVARELGKLAKANPLSPAIEEAVQLAMKRKPIGLCAFLELAGATFRLAEHFVSARDRKERTLKKLTETLCNSDYPPYWRSRVAKTLSKSGEVEKLLPVFLDLLQRLRKAEDPQAHSDSDDLDLLINELIEGIGTFGRPTREVVQILQSFLPENDERNEFERKASEALALLGAPGLRVLIEKQKERALYGSSYIFSRAIRKLRKHPVQSVLELMKERIDQDDSPELVNGWLSLIRYWGPKAQPVAGLILNLCGHSSHRVRESAVDVLGRLELKTVKIERALNEAAGDIHPEVALRARQSLRKLNLS